MNFDRYLSINAAGCKCNTYQRFLTNSSKRVESIKNYEILNYGLMRDLLLRCIRVINVHIIGGKYLLCLGFLCVLPDSIICGLSPQDEICNFLSITFVFSTIISHDFSSINDYNLWCRPYVIYILEKKKLKKNFFFEKFSSGFFSQPVLKNLFLLYFPFLVGCNQCDRA